LLNAYFLPRKGDCLYQLLEIYATKSLTAGMLYPPKIGHISDVVRSGCGSEFVA